MIALFILISIHSVQFILRLVGDLRFSKSGSGGLGLEVDIAVEADDCLRLIWWQSHAAGLAEWVGACGC